MADLTFKSNLKNCKWEHLWTLLSQFSFSLIQINKILSFNNFIGNNPLSSFVEKPNLIRPFFLSETKLIFWY